MIRIIHRVVVFLFVISAALFAVTTFRTSEQRDTDGPEISMAENTVTTSIGCTSEDILAGVTASDSKDGDVTDSLVVQGFSNFIEKGRRQAVLAAFDSDNNVAKAVREVIYEDYVSPRFSLTGPLRFSISEVSDINNVSSAFRVNDCLDGDISSNITISTDNSYISTMVGEYPTIFQVVNSAGDVASLTATVEVCDMAEASRCASVVLSDYLVYIKAGETINPLDYVTGISFGGMEYPFDNSGAGNAGYTKDDIQVYNPVDSKNPGVYEIVYSVAGEAGYQSRIRLIVIVE